MSGAAQVDWFQQNAPSQSEDWFDQNAPKQQKQVPPPQGPVSRFVSSASQAVGAPERASDIYEGPKQLFTHPIESAKLLGSAVLESQKGAARLGLERMQQPGLMNKLGGGLEYLESGIPFLGPGLVHAGRQFEQGDIAGGLGSTAGLAAPALLGSPETRSLAVRGTENLRSLPGRMIAPSPRPSVTELVPQAEGLPRTALAGSEKIFRAAAPAAGEQDFRANLYKASPDLAEIARQSPMKQSGGFIRPDLRVREFVTNVDDHLGKMYQNERVPQIQRNAAAQVQLRPSVDAQDALGFLSRTLGKADERALAKRVASNPTSSLAEIDQLARATNKELLRYEQMDRSKQATTATINRRIAGLKDLDRNLGDAIAGELERRGEPGIRDYEQRYAAIKDVRDTVARRMNAVEAQRMIDRIREFATTRNVGFSAGRAAIGGTGRTLQKGMQTLGASGIAPSRSLPNPPRVAGLLSAGSVITPPTTSESLVTLGEAPRTVQRGPSGRMQRVYGGEVGPRIVGNTAEGGAIRESRPPMREPARRMTSDEVRGAAKTLASPDATSLEKLGARERLRADEGQPPPQYSRGGEAGISPEAVSRPGVHYKVGPSGITYLGKDVDANLRPGEAVVTKLPNGEVRVVNSNGLADSEVIRRYGSKIH